MSIIPGRIRRKNGEDGKKNGNENGGNGQNPDIPGALLVSRERDEAVVNGDNGQDAKAQKALQRERVKEAATEVPATVVGWVDERTGLGPFTRGFMFR